MNYMSRPHVEHYPTKMLVQNCALASFPERGVLPTIYMYARRFLSSKCHFSNFHPHSRAVVPYGGFPSCALWLGIGPMVMLKGFSLRILMDALHREHDRKNIGKNPFQLLSIDLLQYLSRNLMNAFPLNVSTLVCWRCWKLWLCSDLHVYIYLCL